MQLLDVLDRDVLGQVHRLRDGTRDERLDRTHHPHVAEVVDGVVAHGAGEHRQVLGRQVRGADDRLVLVDVGDDLVDLVGRVAQPGERPGHRLVDDRHRAAADQLLGLDQAEVGLDAGGVAVHEQADGPGRGQHAGLRVAHAVLLAELDGQVPGLLGGRQQVGRHQLLVDVGHRVAVHPQHVGHRLDVLVVAGEGPHAGGRAGRRGVGVPGHEGGDGAGPRPALVRVVGQALGHEQGAEVGVADAELPEATRVLGDLLGRVVGVADDDLLGGEDDLDGGAEALDVERRVVVEELHQVEAGQVARRVVEVHVLGARVGAVDPPGVGGGVPPVDGGVELHAGVGALPGGLGDLAEEVTGRHGAHRLAGRPG